MIWQCQPFMQSQDAVINGTLIRFCLFLSTSIRRSWVIIHCRTETLPQVRTLKKPTLTEGLRSSFTSAVAPGLNCIGKPLGGRGDWGLVWGPLYAHSNAKKDKIDQFFIDWNSCLAPRLGRIKQNKSSRALQWILLSYSFTAQRLYS